MISSPSRNHQGILENSTDFSRHGAKRTALKSTLSLSKGKGSTQSQDKSHGHCRDGCFVFRTVISTTVSRDSFSARTLFDTGSDIELISRSFIERVGLQPLVMRSETPRNLTALGTWEGCLHEEVAFTWRFLDHVVQNVTFYVIDLVDDDFDILLGGQMLHTNGVLGVLDRVKQAKNTKFKVRSFRINCE